MLALDTDLRRAELGTILAGLGESNPNWRALDSHASDLAEEIELRYLCKSYKPGEPIETSPIEPLLRSLGRLKSAVQKRDKQEAVPYAELARQILERIRNAEVS
jgi:hypothetical protein